MKSRNHFEGVSTRSQFLVNIVTRFYPPDFAATGQLIDELACYLESQNLEVKVFTGQPGYAFSTEAAAPREVRGNLAIQRSRSSRLLSDRIRGKVVNGLLFFIRAALHLIRARNNPDLILLTTEPPYLPVLGYFIHKLTGIPFICLIYDLYPDIAVNLNVVPINHILVRMWHHLNRQTWLAAKSVIVLSSSMRDRVLQHCPTIADKTFIIPNWSDPNLIYPVPKSQNWFVMKHQLGDCFTVLYSGNLGRCHDFMTIMETARCLQYDRVKFVFIGAGAGQVECMALAKQWQLHNCLFLPYQERQDLCYSLAAADLSLVSIKPGMEGTIAPSKLYGIMAVGRPIAAICAEDSYLVQILREAECGVTIRNGDSAALANYIRHLIDSPQSAKTKGDAARRYFLDRHTLSVVGQQYIDVFRFSLDLPLRTQTSQKVTSLVEHIS